MKQLLARGQDWLFRWQVSDGNGPLVLTQRRIFIIPTRLGLLYGLALVVMLLGAINYNLALGHALVFLLTGLGLVGMIHTFRNLAGLSLSPGRCAAVFVGEAAHFPLLLANGRLQPRLGLEFQALGGPLVDAAVAAQATGSVAVPVPATRRGWLELSRLRLASSYPLGLFRAWSYPNPAMRCLVYPKPVVTPLPPATASLAGQQHQGQGGQEDFSGLREHQPADSPRHIAWKAVARNTEQSPLLVKQFAGGAQAELWLDWNLLPAGLDTESRLSHLAGWVIAADAEQLRYGLRLPRREIPPDAGPAQRQRCLEALALHED